MKVSRRTALTIGGVTAVGGAAALAVAMAPMGKHAEAVTRSGSRLSAANFPKRYVAEISKVPAVMPTWTDDVPIYDFTMRRNPAAQILNGPLTTPVFGFDGVFPGPRIEVDRGTPAVVRHHNALPVVGPLGSPAKTSVHLHGSASLPEFDGYANDVTAPGEYKDYHYPNHQPARTMWYHDPGVRWTAQQAYGGLAGMYLLHDKFESDLLPTGDFDIPLMVNDAMFAADGSLAYDDSTPGLWGDVILVNGRPWPSMAVQRRTYRFRVLVSSISRSFNWRLSNGMPLQVVATDGGLMPKGVAVASMGHGGAERYEVVIDFSKASAGPKRVELLNGSNKNNIDFEFTGKVMAFDLLDTPVTKTRANFETGATEPDPTWDRNYDQFKLVESEIMSLPKTGPYLRRHFRLERSGGQWMFGDMTWQMVEDSNFRKVMAATGIGDVEIWEIENSSSGWFHPVHIHLLNFRVIKRVGGTDMVAPYEQGPKDVVYVGEGETVHLLCQFIAPGVVAPSGDPSFKGGRWMSHGHNLPHEDHDMMGQFQVGEIAAHDPHHPIKAARPKPEPAA